MPALLASDMLALVDADLGPAVRADVIHCAYGGGRTVGVALAGGCAVAVAIHFGWVGGVLLWLCGECGG